MDMVGKAEYKMEQIFTSLNSQSAAGAQREALRPEAEGRRRSRRRSRRREARSAEGAKRRRSRRRKARSAKGKQSKQTIE